MEIILIAAMSANRVIGRNNSIPWDIPGEQARFKKITMGYPLVMGRKTWQSIGRPLPGRRNIVVTRNRTFTAEGAEVVHSLQEAIDTCRDEERVFIIGGEQLYRQGLDHADTLILTVIDRDIDGDTFFPDFSCPPFKLVKTETVNQPASYTVHTYHRLE